MNRKLRQPSGLLIVYTQKRSPSRRARSNHGIRLTDHVRSGQVMPHHEKRDVLPEPDTTFLRPPPLRLANNPLAHKPTGAGGRFLLTMRSACENSHNGEGDIAKTLATPVLGSSWRENGLEPNVGCERRVRYRTPPQPL